MQLPSRSCYQLRLTATYCDCGATAGAPPCAGRRLCVALIGRAGHVPLCHPSPPLTAKPAQKVRAHLPAESAALRSAPDTGACTLVPTGFCNPLRAYRSCPWPGARCPLLSGLRETFPMDPAARNAAPPATPPILHGTVIPMPGTANSGNRSSISSR